MTLMDNWWCRWSWYFWCCDVEIVGLFVELVDHWLTVDGLRDSFLIDEVP